MPQEPGTLCLTFDNMGSARAVGLGHVAGPGPDDTGPAGYPETLDLLDEVGVKATFFIEGWNAQYNPSAIKAIAARGHEIAAHGWVHETLHTLDAIAVERILLDSMAAFRAAGVSPIGFRAPGGKRGAHLLPILKRLGFTYDSSVEHGPEDTEEHEPHPSPVMLDGAMCGIPWQWSNIDYFHYYMHPAGERTPVDVERYFTEIIDELAEKGGFRTLIFHPFVSGQDNRRRAALRAILSHAVSLPMVSIRTAGEVAQQCLGRNMNLPGGRAADPKSIPPDHTTA